MVLFIVLILWKKKVTIYNSSKSIVDWLFEEEKDHLLSLSGFVFEGVAFRAFSSDSSSTVAVHRFFNAEIGGHFFTSNQVEMEAVSEMQQFRYEGEAFYAYADLGL